jgi:hypothetical protein
MGELAEKFGGKVDGELIRATDWNALIDGIEGQFDALGDRLQTAQQQIETNITALADANTRLDEFGILANLVRSSYRQLNLTSARSTYAVGERAVLVANVLDFDGAPLDLSSAASRPWVDFVTVWGSLKPAPGFTSRVGTGGKTVSVQVNASGEARALLREATGSVFAEEDELEIAAVMETSIGGTRVADHFINASTPAASQISPAFAAVSAAYDRSDTFVMRNYLDGIYLANPTRAYRPLAPTFRLNWHDEFATVMAFVKPDDNPATGDSAMAAGSIRVTFRDWVHPWIYTQYLPPPPPLVADYVGTLTPVFVGGIDVALTGVFSIVEDRIREAGILGQQRHFAAVQEAMISIPPDSRPAYFDAMSANVQGGIAVQQGLAFSAAISPRQPRLTAPAAAIVSIQAVEDRVLVQVRAENTRLSNDLLSDNGPVRRAEVIALEASGRVAAIDLELGNKAGLELVSQLLSARDLG